MNEKAQRGSTTFARLAGLMGPLVLIAAGCGEDVPTTAIGDSDAAALAEDNATNDASSETEATTEAGTCLADPGLAEVVSAGADLAGTTITLATHDSFALSEGTLGAFTDATGIVVEQVAVGDAGQLVSQSILTADNPTADVLFGIDNAFLCRGLDAGLFLPYTSTGLADVVDELKLDPFNRVTPIDFGDVCINYWSDELPGEAPAALDDLIDPVNADQFVTQNPETSSPGFAFLLATIAEYGEDGWEDYWQALVDNGLSVTSGWNDAYYGEFIAGGGGRSIVTSYASSPPAEFLFADPPVAAPPTAVLSDSCFRQIEFAGILAGTEHPEAAGALIDYMLGTTYQEDVPLNMFVYPANMNAALPESFVEFGPLVETVLTIDPQLIEANRDDWTDRWNDIVLG